MIVAIIQARMGSTRLPGKVLMEVDGRPLLAYQLDRIQKSDYVEKVVVATTCLRQDDIIQHFCNDYGIDCFRGSENDLITRYYDCAIKYNAHIVVRSTADCPLIDPKIVDDVIKKFNYDCVDYCGNTVPPETSHFPDGSDIEVFSFEALEKAHFDINDEHMREHVTFQFWKKDDYTSSQFSQKKDWSKYRITVDHPEDFEVVEFIFNELKSKKIFGNLEEVIQIIDDNIEIKEKNSHYYFGQGWE